MHIYAAMQSVCAVLCHHEVDHVAPHHTTWELYIYIFSLSNCWCAIWLTCGHNKFRFSSSHGDHIMPMSCVFFLSYLYIYRMCGHTSFSGRYKHTHARLLCERNRIYFIEGLSLILLPHINTLLCVSWDADGPFFLSHRVCSSTNPIYTMRGITHTHKTQCIIYSKSARECALAIPRVACFTCAADMGWAAPVYMSHFSVCSRIDGCPSAR